MKRTLNYLFAFAMAGAMLLLPTGCDLSSSSDGSDLLSQVSEAVEGATINAGTGADDIPASQVVWLDADVSGWAQTATLNAGVTAGSVILDYDKAGEWPNTRTRATDGGPLIGNCWVIVNRDGTWYGATWDWMRPGQTAKARGALTGRNGHIRSAILSSWTPSSGEQVGLMVSTPGRTGERTINERSNIDLVTVP